MTLEETGDCRFLPQRVSARRPGRRIAKLAEVVSLMKAHWQGEELDYSGDFVEVRGYAGNPLPAPPLPGVT